MDTSWELPHGDETLHVYAHTSPGDPTSIGFASDDSTRHFLIRRGIDDETAWLRYFVEMEDQPGSYTFQDPDYQRDGWTPDPRARVIVDFANSLTHDELLEIAQALADQEIAETEELIANRIDAVKRKEQDLTEARRRLHVAHLVVVALKQPVAVRQTATRLAPTFTGTADDLRALSEHLSSGSQPPPLDDDTKGAAS